MRGAITKILVMSIPLLSFASRTLALPKFNPATQCTSPDRGPYPWDFRRIAEVVIDEYFFDPGSVKDLEIFKPLPGWWTTTRFKKTRNNTKCYWLIIFVANSKNRMGGYVGRKSMALWVRNSRVIHFARDVAVNRLEFEDGERWFSEELNKLSTDEQNKVLALVADDSGDQETDTPSYIEELKELAKLRDAGVISEDEFQQKKTEILGLEKNEDNEGGRE